ncbi:hypothetical protein MG293_008837 [Ovis ammon polii]|uniref:Uncharacterized protein n=1 Tax=Ovis ammon polii TaxID=230172 RepID=A0AAD4UCS6_OVIAM|nr:hypothetical protein MG293_008837 [Ovis ammon polii]
MARMLVLSGRRAEDAFGGRLSTRMALQLLPAADSPRLLDPHRVPDSVPVSSRWLYSGRGCRSLKFDWEICLNTRRSAPQWNILNGKKSNVVDMCTYPTLLCGPTPDNNEFDQKVVSGRIWPSQGLPGYQAFKPTLVSWLEQDVLKTVERGILQEWEMQPISNDLGIQQDILPEKTSNRVQMVVRALRGVFGVLSFTVLPYSKPFVTLVLEIMNIHCLIQVTEAPAPSGYPEVSDPA